MTPSVTRFVFLVFIEQSYCIFLLDYGLSLEFQANDKGDLDYTTLSEEVEKTGPEK